MNERLQVVGEIEAMLLPKFTDITIKICSLGKQLSSEKQVQIGDVLDIINDCLVGLRNINKRELEHFNTDDKAMAREYGV